MSIDIMGLMPESVDIKVGDSIYTARLDNGKYILNQVLDKYTEADNVEVYINDKLFDTIDKRIALRQGDTLHLEYSIYVAE